MKVVPVNMPVISNPSQTGLAPEKIQKIKDIASGKTEEAPPAQQNDSVKLGEIATSSTQRIKMDTNKTPDEIFVPKEEPVAQQVEEPKPETAAFDTSVQAKPVPVDSRPVSPELAELAKQRRALQIEREQLAKEKESLKAIPEGYVKIDDLKANALNVLQKAGVTYDQLTNEILGNQSNNEVNQLKAEIESLKKGIDEKFLAKDTAQEEAVYNFMRLEVDKMSNLEPYRLIKEFNAQDKVMDLIKRSWKENGEVLTEDEAMNAIEAELREDAKKYAKVIGELDAPKIQEETTPAREAQRAPKTLTNKDSARPPLSRRQRAIAAALGQKL